MARAETKQRKTKTAGISFFIIFWGFGASNSIVCLYMISRSGRHKYYAKVDFPESLFEVKPRDLQTTNARQMSCSPLRLNSFQQRQVFTYWMVCWSKARSEETRLNSSHIPLSRMPSSA